MGQVTFLFEKLVRDKIITTMQTDAAHIVEAKKLRGTEYRRALLEKLCEEVEEALSARNDSETLEELADIKTVYEQLMKEVDTTQLDKIAATKLEKRGGFAKGDYIYTVTVEEGSRWASYYEERPDKYHRLITNEKGLSPKRALPEIEAGVYRHYKGNYYEVLGVGAHSETHEYHVVYRPLYSKAGNPDIWIRPYEMFVSAVEYNGEKIPRFQKVMR